MSSGLARSVQTRLVQHAKSLDVDPNLVLASRTDFDGERLTTAVVSTFARRRTEIPADVPLALMPSFAGLEGKASQWAGFLRRSRVASVPAELKTVVGGVAAFLGPVLAAAATGGRLSAHWPAGGPWGPRP